MKDYRRSLTVVLVMLLVGSVQPQRRGSRRLPGGWGGQSALSPNWQGQNVPTNAMQVQNVPGAIWPVQSVSNANWQQVQDVPTASNWQIPNYQPNFGSSWSSPYMVSRWGSSWLGLHGQHYGGNYWNYQNMPFNGAPHLRYSNFPFHSHGYNMYPNYGQGFQNFDQPYFYGNGQRWGQNYWPQNGMIENNQYSNQVNWNTDGNYNNILSTPNRVIIIDENTPINAPTLTGGNWGRGKRATPPTTCVFQPNSVFNQLLTSDLSLKDTVVIMARTDSYPNTINDIIHNYAVLNNLSQKTNVYISTIPMTGNDVIMDENIRIANQNIRGVVWYAPKVKLVDYEKLYADLKKVNLKLDRKGMCQWINDETSKSVEAVTMWAPIMVTAAPLPYITEVENVQEIESTTEATTDSTLDSWWY